MGGGAGGGFWGSLGRRLSGLGAAKRLVPNALKNRLKGRLLWAENAGGLLARWPQVSAASSRGSPGVNLFGYRTRPLGLAEAAGASARALAAAGVPVARAEFDEEELEAGPLPPERRAEPPHAVNLCQVNALQAGGLVRAFGPELFRGRVNVGFWVWELPRLPAAWDVAFGYFREIWTPSEFCRRAIAARAPVPVACVPHAVEVRLSGRDWRAEFGLPAGGTVFLCMFDAGSVAERKNPLAAVRAFRAAAAGRQDAHLVVKAGRPERDPAAAAELRAALDGLPARVIDRQLSREESWGLISACDALVSLHRAEGFGLAIAEAMALGKPAVATNYSGNTDFMTAENSFPVRYRLVRTGRHVEPFPKGSEWAEPDAAHAAELVRAILDAPERAREVGRRAARDVARLLAPAAVGRIMRTRLENLGFRFGGDPPHA